MATAAHYVFAALGALALGACGADGTTASCRTSAGEELPRYNVHELNDAGEHPDPELNDKLQSIRNELVAKGCLTASEIPVIDAGPEASGD
jgi:hypothetical protein